MDTEDVTMEEKCENLMNVVVESRKRFGKMCADYEQKKTLMENKILYLQIDTISNYRFKSTNSLPSVNAEDMAKDAEGFAAEIIERKQKTDNLLQKIKDTQRVVTLLKQDTQGLKIRHPISAETILLKHNQNVGIK